MELKTYFAQDAAGNIISSAIVNVFLQGTTTLATGLTRADGTPLENPFAADGAGRIQFRAPDGYYDVQVSAGPGIIQTLTIQCVDYSEAKADADRAESAADRSDVSAEQAQNALNSITGVNTNFEQNSREQWRRSLAEAGLTLVSGSFEEGATANSSTDAVWHISGGQCYTWGGAFPKAVPADSTPTSTGGVGTGAWVSVGDASFRADIKHGDGTLVGVDGDKNLKEKLTEIDSTLTDNSESIEGISTRVKQVEFESINPASPRNVIQYRGAKSVNVMGIHFPMGGFRFLGQYYKTRVPTFSSSTFMNEVNMDTTLPFGMTIKPEQWYAVFAVANDDSEKVKFITMPYLRVDSILNSVITLRKAAERVHVSTPVEYNWDTDLLANSEVLIISEKIGNRSNAFSGRVAKITNATKQSITLDEAGGVGVNDWLLPAPNDFKYYRYCGTFYYDNGEIRNFADSGSIVKNRGVFDISGTNNGEVSSLEKREPSGYISPLASGILIISQYVLSTASTGQLVENFAIDSAHVVVATDFYKALTTSISYRSAEIALPFMFGQQYFYSNAGVMAPMRTQGQQNIWGWIEI